MVPHSGIGLGIFENREAAAGRVRLIFILVYVVKPVFAVLNVSFDDKERVARDVQAINIAVTNAAELFRRLGEFYRPSQLLNFTPIDLRHVVDQA